MPDYYTSFRAIHTSPIIRRPAIFAVLPIPSMLSAQQESGGGERQSAMRGKARREAIW